MLIEPTESETLEELDRCVSLRRIQRKATLTCVVARFCEAMIQIRKEVEDIVIGKQPKENNLLKNAPHPISVIAEAEWDKLVVIGNARLALS